MNNHQREKLSANIKTVDKLVSKNEYLKAKDFYVGFLTGYSTPVDKHEPHLWLGFFGNPAHYITIPLSKIKQLHYMDVVLARPKFLD